MNSFIWKNQDSYLNYGIVINKLPSLIKAERNVDEIEIQGRDGDVTIDYKTYKPVIYTLECTVLDEDKMESIKSWLDGFGDLIFSWRSDKYYKAKMINKIDISESMDSLGEFPLLFKCQPHAYSLGNEIITLTDTGTIYNSGSAIALPIIKLFGTGSLTLTINGNIVNLTDVVDYVTINSDLMDCYKDTLLKNNDMSGEFPILEKGNNYISWTGTVSKVEITPNWRFL